MKEYTMNRTHLPLPPADIDPKIQEAFMTINILRDDPYYIIDNCLIPLKNRFIDDPIQPHHLATAFPRYKLNSFTFGAIKTHNGA